MTKIFILNGPPSSGKDTLANHIVAKWTSYRKEKFAGPLKAANKALFSLTDEEYNMYEGDPVLKETPQKIFYGKSWRDVNKDLSEKFAKVNFAEEFFGASLTHRIAETRKPNIAWLISDGGFEEEIRPMVKAFGKDSVILIRLVRKGFDFSNDSRNYVDGENLGIKQYELQNGDLQLFLENGSKLIYDLT